MFAGVRDPATTPAGAVPLRLDVADPGSIAAAAARLTTMVERLDVLINNAAISPRSPEVPAERANRTLGALEPEGWLAMLRVNTLGPALVTQALLPLLGPGSVVMHISSRKAALSLPAEEGNYAYTSSKAALNRVARTLARDLAPRGVRTVLVHPGELRTRLGGPDATLDPADIALSLLTLADRAGPGAPAFLRWDGSEHPW